MGDHVSDVTRKAAPAQPAGGDASVEHGNGALVLRPAGGRRGSQPATTGRPGMMGCYGSANAINPGTSPPIVSAMYCVPSCI